VRFLPGYRTLLSMDGLLANLLPQIPGVTAGRNWFFRNKHQSFRDSGWDIHSQVAAWRPGVTLHLADAAATKELMANRARFPKPVWMYGALSYFGPNIVAAEGELWKKYRKISAPAFSEPNNKLVWAETLAVMDDLLSTKWHDKDEVHIDNCLLELTQPLTLFVIGAAAFGRRISWEEDNVVPPRHKLTFRDAMHTVSVGVPFKVVLPTIVMKMSATLRKIDLAFDELRLYLQEMIEERLTSVKVEQHDLFSNLLAANDVDEGALTNDDIVANIFIFLLAGHETTANTICFALALLALHPDVQEELFKHIRSVVPDGTRPAYDHMHMLNYALAVINETLRMFPPVVGIPKESSEDTTLRAGNLRGENLTVPVPKGTTLMVSTPGLHYNPRYWKDPHEFRPSRFLGEWDRDAFVPFSGGARGCLGRRFAEIESVAVLCMIVTRYKIEVKYEPEFAGETFEARKERVLQARPGLTLTPVRVPLTFKRRV